MLSTRAQLFTPAEPVADLATTDTTADLYRLTAPNPRAWVVNTVRVTADQAALPLLGDASFDPETTALLAPPAVLGLEDGGLALPGANSVRLERLAPNRLLARSNSEHGGLLVVSENWLPGWRATATIGSETQAVPVYRANLTFLGVPVKPGESTIDLVYRPDSIRFGLGISGVSLVTWLGACGVRAWAGRRKRAATPSYMLSRIAQRAALPAILLLAATLRAFRLGFQELRGDEALGRLFSLESFDQIIRSTLALHEPHPVASYFVEHIWLRIAGNSEFALRFATLWFGVLAVALVYRLGRRLSLGRRIPALAAALLAISPYAIWHSQDARMYSMSLALTTASTLLMLEGLARRSAQRWAAYIVITLLALHTHYYAAYIVIAQNLFVIGRALWARSERRQLFAWLLVQAATGLYTCRGSS